MRMHDIRKLHMRGHISITNKKKLIVATSISRTRASLASCCWSLCWAVWLSNAKRTRLARTRAWTLTKACIQRRVIAACFLTAWPRTRACSLTNPFKARRALLALHVCKTVQIFIRSVSWNLNAVEMILKKWIEIKGWWIRINEGTQ